MENYQKDFGPFDGKVWLNSASEGAMPQVALAALAEAGEWKRKPYLLTNQKFAEVPERLRKLLGRLINVLSDDIILGNSATYGIHLLANGIVWKKGEEVLLMENDFPAGILPWLALDRKGVKVRQLKPQRYVLEPREVEQYLTEKTRLVCLSHVHTFTGHKIDVVRIGEMCRAKGILFVVNLTQTLGNTPVDLSQWPVDAITSSGFKWLCGPYGTGFCWIAPALRETLEYNHAFWVSLMSTEDLSGTGRLTLPEIKNGRRYDVFGTANFFNFHPWKVSLEYLLAAGIDNIHEHNDGLVEEIVQRLDPEQYELISPRGRLERSALVVISHHDRPRNAGIFGNLKREGIYPALWKGNIRISPHLYNTRQDINRLLSVLQ
jgi:selenocysteine lyase/cysteine desulfurase